MLRIAMTGCSGSGKSTLTEYLADLFNLPVNPVGSRSVAAAMGFASPYDVDKVGRRAEFQRRLIAEKAAWEVKNDAFVTDRTTADHLAYQSLHDVHSVTDDIIESARDGLRRYTHVFYCPFDAFCRPDHDPARVQDMAYHFVYDAVLVGLLSRLGATVIRVQPTDVASRKAFVGSRARFPDAVHDLRLALSRYDATNQTLNGAMHVVEAARRVADGRQIP